MSVLSDAGGNGRVLRYLVRYNVQLRSKMVADTSISQFKIRHHIRFPLRTDRLLTRWFSPEPRHEGWVDISPWYRVCTAFDRLSFRPTISMHERALWAESRYRERTRVKHKKKDIKWLHELFIWFCYAMIQWTPQMLVNANENCATTIKVTLFLPP